MGRPKGSKNGSSSSSVSKGKVDKDVVKAIKNAEKIKKKQEVQQVEDKKDKLRDLFYWLSCKQDNPKSSDVSGGSWPSRYVLESSDSDPSACVICETLYNTQVGAMSLKAKTAGVVAKLAATTPTLSKRNPSHGVPFNDYFFDKNVWMPLRKRFPEITENDKPYLLTIYSKEELEELAGIEKTEKIKGLVKHEELKISNESSDFMSQGAITKETIYNVMCTCITQRCIQCPTFSLIQNRCSSDLNQKYFKPTHPCHTQPNPFSYFVIGDTHVNVKDDLMSELKVLFIGECPAVEEINNGLPFMGKSGMMLRTAINSMNLQPKDHFITNTCFCFHEPRNTPTFKEIVWCFDYLEYIINSVNRRTIIVPIGNIPMKRLGNWGPVYEGSGVCYLYNDRLVCPMPHPSGLLQSGKGLPEYMEYMSKLHNVLNNIDQIDYSNLRKVTTEEARNLLIKKCKEMEEQPIAIQQEVHEPTINQEITTQFPQSLVASTEVKTVSQLMSTLEDGWTIVNVNKRVENYTNKKGETRQTTKTPYIVLRKGKEKRIEYVEPYVDLFYTKVKRPKIAEYRSELTKVGTVPYSKIVMEKKRVESEVHGITSWYNDDYPIGVYILTEIRDRYKYKEREGDHKPRIWYLDIETEMDAIKVKYTDDKIDAKCRLITIYDNYEEVFDSFVYTTNPETQDVLIQNHKDKLEKIILKLGTKEENGQTVDITKDVPVRYTVCHTEEEIFQKFNEKLYEYDPDLITGWNVEQFDMTYLIVRGKTIGVPITTPRGQFDFVPKKNKSGGVSIFIFADGISVIDYSQLYKMVQPQKRENYKLDYICELELGTGKLSLPDTHDNMYIHDLGTYLEYNLIDVARVIELESKLNYLNFETEICRICNIGWTDIYSKMRQIDGLFYQYIEPLGLVGKQKNYKSYQQDTNNLPKNNDGNEENGETKQEDEDDSYEGAKVLSALPGIYEESADIDVTAEYPSVMINYNTISDTHIATLVEESKDKTLGEIWLYRKDEFPEKVLVRIEQPEACLLEMTRQQFEEFLKDKILTVYNTIYWKPNVKESVVSRILKYLIGKRGHYRKLLKEARKAGNHQLADRYQVIQTAYKQLINSIYGVMGTPVYRFSDFETASTITASGRELIRIGAHQASKFLETMIEKGTIDINPDEVEFDVTHLDKLSDLEQRRLVIYGDTDSCFLNVGEVVRKLYPDTTKEERQEIAWKIIKKTASYINNKVTVEIMDRKGISSAEEHENYKFEFKEELIINRGLFMNKKKHYALHVVMNNGAKVDEIDVKGIEAKKSDYPRFTREFMMNIITTILKKYDVTKVDESNQMLIDIFNNAVKRFGELALIGSVDISRPVSLAQDLRGYNAIQSHVKGMLAFDTIYDHEFRTGHKGYKFDITAINWKAIGLTEVEFYERFAKKFSCMKWYSKFIQKPKFDSIVIPVEMDHVDTNLFILDLPHMIDFSIYDRVTSMFDVIGISVRRPQKDRKQRAPRAKKIKI